MKKLIEQADGSYRAQIKNGEKTSFFGNHEKGSDSYVEKIAEGYELIELSQSEKDVHTLELHRQGIMHEISALDLKPYQLENCLKGDPFAIALLDSNTEKKNLLRIQLNE